MATQTTTSKLKSTYVSPNNKKIKYQLLCGVATAGNLDTVSKRYGLFIAHKYGNGNVTLQCVGSRRKFCQYRGLFVAKNKAIYVIPGRTHNHPVKVLANAAQKGF